MLNNLLPDVYIYADHYKGKDSGASPGYAVALVSESTSGALLSSQRTFAVQDTSTSNGISSGAESDVTINESNSPETLGRLCAKQLCEEVAAGGYCDSAHQSLVLFLMAVCPEDVSRVRLGQLTPYTVETLRIIKDFFGVVFKIVPDPKSKTSILSCLGMGVANLARRAL